MRVTPEEIGRRVGRPLPQADWHRRFAVTLSALKRCHAEKERLLREVGWLRERVRELEGRDDG